MPSFEMNNCKPDEDEESSVGSKLVDFMSRSINVSVFTLVISTRPLVALSSAAFFLLSKADLPRSSDPVSLRHELPLSVLGPGESGVTGNKPGDDTARGDGPDQGGKRNVFVDGHLLKGKFVGVIIPLLAFNGCD